MLVGEYQAGDDDDSPAEPGRHDKSDELDTG